MNVRIGEGIRKGAKLGTIGNAGGIYWAHLHLEIRNEIGLELGGGYSSNKSGYLDPTKFIEGNRKVMWEKVSSN
jgi:murein DD-endopeptidase MepM/ murein hydrolase activator NlpD